MKHALTAIVLCLILSQQASAGPKKKVIKAVLVQFAEHVTLGGGLYFAGAYAAGGPHPNWQAGIVTAGAGAFGKELLGDYFNGKDKLVHDCPQHCVLVHIPEILVGAGAAAAAKH